LPQQANLGEKMSGQEQEVEVKFFINNLPALENKLKHSGAELSQESIHELNLRYDTPDGALSRAHRVLRLRQENHAVLTYKGPAEAGQAVTVRQEIEVEVSSFSTASHLLEALGYQMIIMYEKERATYSIHDVRVTLDQLPYGNFIEIEGPNAEAIKEVASLLHLDWEARVLDSYLAIFYRLREEKSLNVRNLSFEDFKGITVNPDDLHVRAADLENSPRSLS
jgi:adenylate cyclase, class 2